MSNEFYVTLPSDSSYKFFPQNTKSHFRTKLSQRINFDYEDEWNVGLAEISLPSIITKRNALEVDEDDRLNERNATPSNRESSPPIVISSNGVDVKLDDEYIFTIPKGRYESLSDAFIAPFLKLNNIKRQQVISNVSSYKAKLDSDSVKGVDSITYKESAQIVGKYVTYILPLGRYDSFKDLFDKAIKNFSREGQFKIVEEVRVLSNVLERLAPLESSALSHAREISKKEQTEHYDRPRLKRTTHDAFLNVYVYTDIIKPQLVGDSLSRCLRVVNLNIGQHHQTFNPIHYYPVERKHLETIELLLADKRGEKIPFYSGEEPSIVVLHFIKKKVF